MNITNCISTIKVGEHMIISANEEKVFDKIQHFHEKNIEQISRRKVSKHNKGHIWTTHSEHIQWWETKNS